MDRMSREELVTRYWSNFPFNITQYISSPNEDKHSKAIYKTTSYEKQYPKDNRPSGIQGLERSAFVRRVPVIKRFEEHTLKNRKPSFDDVVYDEEYSIRRDAGERRSVSPVYSMNTFDELRRKRDSKLDSNLTVYKKGKLTILFNEKDQSFGNESQQRSPSPSPSYVFGNVVSPSFLPSKTQFIFPSRQFRATPYPQVQTSNPVYDHYPPHNNSPQRSIKRIRTIYTPSQLKKLEEKFNECNFIVGEDRQMLAQELKLQEQQVKIWFQNRRTKSKQAQNTTDRTSACAEELK